uniref:CCR4-NOT transcription complex subunit 9 isoform X3 n=1 Tax=Elaeis guineensis var. tenera TaxID=51953 RepID=A0A6I9SDM6_ELAGV|nr:CCR4-NOT transcription complex subunit 9 isoform X3 [Elaeis guineensis]
MSKLPLPFAAPSPSAPVAAGAVQPVKDRKMASAEQLVLDLLDPHLRENALLDLSKKREIFQDLAPLLWNSYGTIAALLQEIVSIYPYLSPPTLSPGASNRVCNALALLQCVASHPDTRIHFLNAHIPLYLYPFLNTTSKTRPFEYLRLTSLGVIGALVKVATFIVQKILLDDVGLRYICATADRFYAVGQVLGSMVTSLAEQPSTRLLKHIIRCYQRLSEHPRACDSLKNCLPDMLKDGTFNNCLRDDPGTREWLQQLQDNVSGAKRVANLHARLDHMMGN